MRQVAAGCMGWVGNQLGLRTHVVRSKGFAAHWGWGGWFACLGVGGGGGRGRGGGGGKEWAVSLRSK